MAPDFFIVVSDCSVRLLRINPHIAVRGPLSINHSFKELPDNQSFDHHSRFPESSRFHKSAATRMRLISLYKSNNPSGFQIPFFRFGSAKVLTPCSSSKFCGPLFFKGRLFLLLTLSLSKRASNVLAHSFPTKILSPYFFFQRTYLLAQARTNLTHNTLPSFARSLKKSFQQNGGIRMYS